MADQDLLRRVAVLNAIAAVVNAELRRSKDLLGEEVVRGRLEVLADPADPTSAVLGTFTMSKPRQGSPRIVDETLAMSWAVDEFGEEGIVRATLTDQGRASVLAAFKAGRDVPGVERPPLGDPVPAFRQDDAAKSAAIELSVKYLAGVAPSSKYIQGSDGVVSVAEAFYGFLTGGDS